MRIFASDRVKNFMKALGMQSGEAIEHRMVTNAIEKAQRKVEGRNFDIRKQLLEFDDVNNEQRKVIYHMRNTLLAADNIGETIADFRQDVLNATVSAHIPPQSLPEQWDVAGLEAALKSDFGVDLPVQQWLDEDDHLYEETLREKLMAELLAAYNEKEEKLVRTPEYYIDTDGINLQAILALPEVDQTTTRSVDVWEMYETYGIEGARNTLLEEIRTVLRTNGAYVNYHNLSLLVDLMTHNGSLTSISRFGFNKLDKSPISKSSFEMTVEQLKLAALSNETDDMQNVSARIMFGQAIRGGTGKCDLVLDESAYGVTDDQIEDLFV